MLRVSAPADTSGMSVGRTGAGVARIQGSTLDLGGGALYVGRFSGADGTMIATAGSVVTAGYVGVGRNKTGDGGTGTFIVNGSTLTASTIEIGPNGYLGGNGTIVGNIVNYGIVSPGNSPGTLTVDGSFVSGLGGRLLMEAEADGNGGFNTDHLIFTSGSNVDMAGLEVRFRFSSAQPIPTPSRPAAPLTSTISSRARTAAETSSISRPPRSAAPPSAPNPTPTHSTASRSASPRAPPSPPRPCRNRKPTRCFWRASD